MSSHTDASANNTAVDTTVARIAAQDLSFVEPLREYLERNGCRVVVNTAVEQDVLYAIGVGDSQHRRAGISPLRILALVQLPAGAAGIARIARRRRCLASEDRSVCPLRQTGFGADELRDALSHVVCPLGDRARYSHPPCADVPVTASAGRAGRDRRSG